MVAGKEGGGGFLFLRSDGGPMDLVLSCPAASCFFHHNNFRCWIYSEDAALVGSRGGVRTWLRLSSICAILAAAVMEVTAFSSDLHHPAIQRLPAVLAISWFTGRGALLEVASLLIHVVDLLLLSCIHLKYNNLEPSLVLQGSLHTREGISSPFPRYSDRLKAVVQGMCWTEPQGHLLIVMLDAVRLILLYASNQILETTSSSKINSNDCMHLRSQDLIDCHHGEDSCPIVFAAHCLEYQNWNYLLCANLWNQANIITVHMMHNNYVRAQHLSLNGSKHLGFRILRLQFDLNADVSTFLKLAFRSIMATTLASHERYFLHCFGCFCLSLSYDRCVEDAVSLLFGMCHRRCTTTPPLLILRFNGKDTHGLSSVKAIQYLQLNSIPRVHIPDRPSGEPPAGHQLDRTFIEALEDCRCGNFESVLSTDGRTPYGSICDLQHLHEFRSSPCYVVQLGMYLSCSTLESHVTMYFEP